MAPPPLPTAFTHVLQTLSPSDNLLSSVLTLPPNPSIVYATYSPSGVAPPSHVLESARRYLVSRNKSSSFQHSILPHVHINSDVSTFHAFLIVPNDQVNTSLSTLKHLTLDHLTVSESSYFTPHGLYPCSLPCADNRIPCPSCLAPNNPSLTSTARLLPRKPLRQIYTRFIDAVRTYIIDSIVTASLTSALRFDNGFLLIPNLTYTEWGADWDHHAHLRPLVHCHLDLHLASNRLELHTLFRAFPHVPLLALLPLPPGTPLTLLPTGAPAFLLSHYSAPAASLTAHFTCSLAPHPFPHHKDPQYIIAWLAVQNKHGEDKGIPIIWPAALCLVSNSSSRKPLAHIPELPPQLQPSPPPLPPPSINAGTPRADAPSTPLRVLTNHPLTRRPAMVSPSPLRVLRMLTLTHTTSLQNVASEVSGYVESVVRERDRERERIRKEREAISSVSPQVVTPAAAVLSTIPTPAPDTNYSLQPTSPTPTEHTHPSIYYPSPLTELEPPAHVRSPSVPELPTPLPETSLAPVSTSFDPFNTMDTSWSQPASEFMDYDLGPAGPRRPDMDFADYDTFTFTDDDFSFFDRPSRLSDAAPPPLGLSPSILSVSDIGASFTPATGARHSPELLRCTHVPPPAPPSPPGSHSAPSTPHVRVTHPPSQFARTFEPIPFAPSHSHADSKYSSAGKFALPSPPDEEDRTSPLPALRLKSHSITSTADLRARYSAATDPRISVVRQLIGVKRKSKSFDHGRGRFRQFLFSSYDESIHEDPPPPLEDDEKSELASEDDADMDDERERSTTPPPSYLPLGPMLLHTHFHHALLLPLCQPLRPPGSAVAPMSLAVPLPPVAAPTPVSPAASLEKINQELAAVGEMLTQEVVENPVWARAWGCRCTAGGEQMWPSDIQVLADILKRVDVLDGPVELLTMFAPDGKPAAEDVYLQRLDPPMFSVGKSGCVVQVLPSALRFWEKLGLTPYGGKRDVVAFVFLEEGGLEKQRQAEVWLDKMSAAYNAKQLGSFTAGSSTMCPANGVMPLRLENLRKSIRSFLQCLESKNDLVFYIAIPDSAIALDSTILREIFSFVKHTQAKRSEAPILFQFVPEHLIASSDSPSSEDSEIDALCYATYRRMLKSVERSMARQFDKSNETVAYFREQPFVLARSSSSTVQFAQSSSARTLDVLDRHTLLHVGYRFSACGKWLFVACVDQRGESHDLRTWLIQDEIETSAVVQVWNFVLQFAKRANVEWRIVIAKLGSMTASELEGWNIHLSTAVPLCNDLPPFHVSLLSVEQNLCWPVIPHIYETAGSAISKRSPTKDSKSLYVDTATPAYAIYPSTRIPLTSRSSLDQVDLPFIPDNDGTTSYDTSSILPISTSILVRSPSKLTSSAQSSIYIHFLHALHAPGSSLLISDDIMRKDITLNFQELSVLAGAMLGFQENLLLPFHLAALEVMHDSLRQDDLN